MKNNAFGKDAATSLDELVGSRPATHSRRRWWWLFGAFVIVLASVAVFAVSGEKKSEPRYAIRDVELGTLTVKVTATGNLQPTNQVEVGSELSGIVENVITSYSIHYTKLYEPRVEAQADSIGEIEDGGNSHRGTCGVFGI